MAKRAGNFLAERRHDTTVALYMSMRRRLALCLEELEQLSGIEATKISHWELTDVGLELDEILKIRNAFESVLAERIAKAATQLDGLSGPVCKRIRRVYRISQAEVAAEIGVLQPSLATFEIGGGSLSPDQMTKLKAALTRRMRQKGEEELQMFREVEESVRCQRVRSSSYG
jgi:predicted transcriptional regulator